MDDVRLELLKRLFDADGVRDGQLALRVQQERHTVETFHQQAVVVRSGLAVALGCEHTAGRSVALQIIHPAAKSPGDSIDIGQERIGKQCHFHEYSPFRDHAYIHYRPGLFGYRQTQVNFTFSALCVDLRLT
ncbi:hypothetical protein D3C75_957550 [compost metagenome]